MVTLFLKKYGVLILCILGSFTRLVYGYLYEPWNDAPDHLAWELIIEQHNVHYDHLIHYPHEGGTILVSLLCYIVEWFTSFSSLTIVAIVLDFFIRFLQINIVKRVFNLQTAMLFGGWTIFAAPFIIPWGTVNFGLHYVASVFPFILLFLLAQKKDSIKHHLMCGAFLGVAFWFSYSNIILIPVFFLYKILTRSNTKKWLYSSLSLGVLILLHLLTRQFFDAGFHVTSFAPTSIRGEVFSLNNINILHQLQNMPSVIANAMAGLPHTNQFMNILRPAYYFLFVASIIGFLIAYKKHRFHNSVYLIFLIILFFLIIYVLSPFIHLKEVGNYASFRHLAYIVPLISLWIILGFLSSNYKYVVIVFLLLGTYRTCQLFTMDHTPSKEMSIKAAGWVLGAKFGHDPEILTPILKDNPEKGILLSQGIGWGICASLMQGVDAPNMPESSSKVNELVEIVSIFPTPYQNDLLEGIEYSFSDQVIPRLNKHFHVKVEEAWNKRSSIDPS